MEIKGHKAFLLDVETRTIKDIVIRDWTQIRDYIGEECDTFTCPISWPNGDTLYADDEGLFHTIKGGVVVPNLNQIIVGNVVILGGDMESGESEDVFFKKEEIEQLVHFITEKQAQAYADRVLSIGPTFMPFNIN